jgi:photosystem II stability/assembly factor-like uncharacterized protein
MKSFFRFILTILFLPLLLHSQQKQISTIFKVNDNEVGSSVDGGKNWEKLKLPFDKTPTAFSWDAKTPERILAATQGAIYRSSSGGKNWQPVLMRSPRFEPLLFSVSTNNPLRMYCAGTMAYIDGDVTEIWQSMDGGMRWQRVIASRDRIETIHIDPDNPTQKISFSVQHSTGDR